MRAKIIDEERSLFPDGFISTAGFRNRADKELRKTLKRKKLKVPKLKFTDKD